MKVHLLIEWAVAVEALGLDVLAHREFPLTLRRENELNAASGAGHLRRHAREHDDRELEPFRRVDGEDPNRVVVGFGQDRFGDPGALRALQCRPRKEAAQVGAAGLAERAGLIRQEADVPPYVATPRRRERDLEY